MSDSNPITKQQINHYRTYMKIYGALIMELADYEQEVIKLINDEHEGLLMQGLRERIEQSEVYEK